MVCLHVMLLDWLFLNRPAAAPIEIRLGVALTSKQWSAVAVLKSLAWDRNTPVSVDAASMGRAAAKFESFDLDVGAVHRAMSELPFEFVSSYFCANLSKPETEFDVSGLRSGFFVSRVDRAPMIAAKAIRSGRLQFPSAPAFKPQPYMDESTAALFDDPLKFAAAGASFVGEVPKVRVHADPENLVQLCRKLADTGRLKPVPATCKRDSFVSGMFAVGKDLERDRLIMDSRPPNLLEAKPAVWTSTMASAAVLPDLFLEPHQVLLSSGEDLRDFFYQFVTTEARTRRNILSEPLTIEQARAVFGPTFDWPEQPVWVGLSTLAMGDTNSCEFAQCAHLGVCRQHQVFYDHELLTMRSQVPRGLLSIGIIIDDLVVLEKILRSDLNSDAADRRPFEAEERLARALQGYANAGLEVNLKKEFKNEVCARFWGVELDGDAGLLRPSSLRLWPLILVTLRVASLQLCSVGLLEALSGSWISMFMLRRRLMCTMELIFEALAVSDQKAVLRLSPEMIDELWTLALLGPLACVNLRAEPVDFLIATDSSLDWTAGVSARLPRTLSAEVMRRSLKRGVWAKLLPPHKAWLREHALLGEVDQLPDSSYSSHPLWNLLATGLDYEFNWRRKIIGKKHINVTELDANLHAERRCAANLRHKRIPYALDSQVSLGCLVKGRAASSTLNGQLRRSLPYMLGADLYGYYIYFPSALNRADAPTRDKDIPPPDVQLPDWWEEAAMGNFTSFDEWISMVEAGVVEPEFDLKELEPRAEADLAPAKQVRSAQMKQARAMHVPVSKLREALKVEHCPREDGEALDSDSKLAPEAIEILRSFRPNQFFSKTKPFLLLEPGAVDLYSGKFGVARQLVQCGAPWVLTFEIERSHTEDLLDACLQRKLVRLLELRAVKILGPAIVCRSFSTAVTPPVRTLQHPRGLPSLSGAMREKAREGNQQSDNLDQLIQTAEEHDCGYWFENPDLSWLFKQKRFSKYTHKDSEHIFRFCMCRFGTAWKKPTRIGTNIRGLTGLRLPCKCNRPHVVLRGRSKKHKKNWTAVAQPYPSGLCKLVALACSIHANWSEHKRLDVGACCRAGSLRIGEASHPGPRRTFQRQAGQLEAVHLRAPATEALEARQLESFIAWSRLKLPSADPTVIYDVCPGFLADALQTYGTVEFRRGGALSNFRHLILAVQRWKPIFKLHSAKCWELVGRWELCEPVSHRPPIPEVVVKSMICLAWQLGWLRWCGVTLLAFYGAGRIGEVLRCRREDLLFPRDALDEKSGAIFLQLKQFKSLGRQPSRVQRMKVENAQACRLLSKIYLDQPAATVLYPCSASVYRKRWDKLLFWLDIPADSKLTPGSLRGGAAVNAYKAGKTVPDIMWAMRLRSQQTLESYLQEVAAIGALRELSSSVRHRLCLLGAIFDNLFNGAFRDPVLG